MRRALRPLAFLSLLAVVAAGPTACGGGTPSAPSGSVPGIVLVCLDTLRADALGKPGGPPGRLPALEGFATSATRFLDASAPAPWTSPSVGSLLTGLEPRSHGMTLGFDPSAKRDLSSALKTLAEVLDEKGWFTAAATGGGWITPDQGFGQGFRHFSGDFDVQDPRRFLASWNERRAKGAPFFLFLHTFAAHDPYGDKTLYGRGLCGEEPEAERAGNALAEALDAGGPVPAPVFAGFLRHHLTSVCRRKVLDRILGPERMRRCYRMLPASMQGGWKGEPDGGKAIREDLRAAYDAGLAHVNERLAGILAGLEAAELPAGTVVVVVSDHGELFGEGGQLYHGQSLHDAILAVTVLVRAPGRLPAGGVVRGSCSLVDVAPTLLELAGIATPRAMEGISLVSLAKGTASPRPVIAEGELAGVDGRAVRGLYSVRTAESKWVASYDLATGAFVDEAVYDLVADPSESSPGPAYESRARGDAFCRAVAKARNAIRARFSLPPAPDDCVPR